MGSQDPDQDPEVTIRPDESSVLNEFQSFFQETNIPRNADAFRWWCSNQDKYPHLALLARRYLSAPMASIASEREFKVSKRITVNRWNLKPGNVEVLLFLKFNLRMVNYKY